jgi:hypothetical protein
MNEKPAEAVCCGFFLVGLCLVAIPVQEKAIASPSSTKPGTTANYSLGKGAIADVEHKWISTLD